jgi:DNA modification methylase
MKAKGRPASPKLRAGDNTWYRYYAGYTMDFVRDVLEQTELEPDAVVLDPWNGAGTTVQAAHNLGLAAIGFDLNPVMCHIARARFVTQSMLPGVKSGADVVSEGLLGGSHAPLDAADSLLAWFGTGTARAIRNAQQVLARLECRGEDSPTRAILQLALFETVRAISAPQATSNPTWFRARREGRRIGAPASALAQRFRAHLDDYATRLVASPARAAAHMPLIGVSSCDKLPLDDEAVDVVVASPPYCTRIDYGVATLPELMTLGFDWAQITDLRRRLMGTPLTSPSAVCLPESPTLARFMAAVAAHPSKASSTYYWRFFAGYYTTLDRCLLELRRVLKRGGRAVLVVQDSYFKEILNPLADILIEIASVHGLNLIDRHDYPVPRTRAAIHTFARTYRSSFETTESGLILARAA